MAKNGREKADDECVWIAIGNVAAGIFAMTNARSFRAANENGRLDEKPSTAAPRGAWSEEETPRAPSAREDAEGRE